MKFFYSILIIMLLLLFVGGPDSESHRIYKSFWDMGHTFLFAGLVYIMMQTSFFKKKSVNTSFLLVMILCISLGLAIEILQTYVERDFEVFDLISDLAGAIIGYFIALYIDKRYLFNIRNISVIFIVVLSLLSSVQLIAVMIDEINMRKNFPVLADFSTPFNLTRWDAEKAKLELNSEFSSQDNNLLDVVFLPGKYSDITLQHFVRDWTGYQYLNFKIFNTKLKPIDIELKIYDETHIQHRYKYNDRYNKSIRLNYGWNNIHIPLYTVINSPKKRKLDISHIKSLSLFLTDVTKPTRVYVGDIRLI